MTFQAKFTDEQVIYLRKLRKEIEKRTGEKKARRGMILRIRQHFIDRFGIQISHDTVVSILIGRRRKRTKLYARQDPKN